MKAKMITRTVVSTVARVKGVDESTDSVITETVILPGKYESNADILKAVKRLSLPYIPVSAAFVSEVTKRYGMEEEKFIQNAIEL